VSPVEVGLIGFVVLFALLAFGLPIGFGMALVGFAGFWYLTSGAAAVAKMAITPFQVISSYEFAVLPLFIFMANIIFVSGLGKDLYSAAAKWLGHLPGGLAIATVGACAVFAAVSASSIATALTLGLVSLPEMKKYNYDAALATGCVAAGGTIGVLIPPSAVLIVYGIITQVSIGKLFLAGIVPGVLEAVFYVVTILIICSRNPKLGPRGPRYSLREKAAALRSCGEIIALIILVLGGLMLGWFTPTEAGAVGAFGAICFAMIRMRLNWQKFTQATIETVKTTGMIFGILIGAFIFQYFTAVTTIPNWLADFIGGLPIPPLAIIGFICLVYIALGCLIDVAAMVLLTVPVLFPVILSLGFNPIWFGIIVCRMCEIGMITPPVGLNVFAISGVAKDVPMKTIFKGIIPFLIADISEVLLLIFVPAVVLFLPNLMR
jgi:tripartite ATP-independent transporter DctM subunit